MLTALLSRCIILVFAILHPAYKSYKSLRQKNHKETLTWMMYWIVFALYTAVETVTDIVLCWIPFYYEMKIALILWMVLPITKGYSIIFRRLIHPELSKREPEIDHIIEKASEKGYSAILDFGAKGINFAASTVLTTAVKGQQLLASRSLSLGDLSQTYRTRPMNPSLDEIEDVFDELDSSISAHGDTPGLKVKSKSRSSKQPYDTGTFPRRRGPIKELNSVPEEDGGSDYESHDRKQKEKFSVTQVYLNAISPKRASVPSLYRAQSDLTEERLRSKPPLYRPMQE